VLHRSLNKHRERRAITGSLYLLRFKSKGDYEQLLEVAEDWSAWPVLNNEEERTAFTIQAEIDEGDSAERNAEVDVAFRAASDFAVEGTVFKVERDHSAKNFLDPKRWKLRGYMTEGRWPRPDA
jgi:hypothetical protein